MQERNASILKSLQVASPMIRNLARSLAFEYDELYQVAAEVTLSRYEQAQRASNPAGYLQRTIRNAILTYTGVSDPAHRKQTLADRYLIESLDAPLGQDSSLSLSDLVSDTSQLWSEDTRDYSRLYTVISSLPPLYREVLCMRYGICGYGTYHPSEIARILGISYQAVYTRIYRAQAMLQEYTELLDLVRSATERN